MLTLLTALRWASLLIWLANVVRLAPAARRSLTSRRLYLDPLWAVLWGLSLNRVWFVSRDIYYHPAPGPIEVGFLIVGYMSACVLAAILYQQRGAYGD